MTPVGDIRPKWLTVAQLKRVLADLPDDHRLVCSNVTLNLAVFKGEVTHDSLVGQIDFLGEGEYQDLR